MSSTGKIIFWAVILCICKIEPLDAQAKSELPEDLGYHVNYWVTVPLICVGAGTNAVGLDRARDKSALTLSELSSRKYSSVPSFDRIALRQNPARYKEAEEFSDVGITWGTLAPAVLIFADRKMRRDWLDIAVVYIETQTLVSNFYAWSFLGPTFIERYRPITYYADVPLEDRLWGGNRNSFYSGHVSVTAVTTFFMAQSYLDYHPEQREKRWLFYGLAAIPPMIIGVERVRALKHFPSDVTVGFIVGAMGGIFLPQMHHSNKNYHVSLSVAFEPEYKAFGCVWSF